MNISLAKKDDAEKLKKLRNIYECNIEDKRLSFAEVVRKAVNEALDRAAK